MKARKRVRCWQQVWTVVISDDQRESNKVGEGGWRKNYKGCKHVPFIQCYLNPEDLGLKFVKNFKQYLKHEIRLFRVLPSVLYLTLYILLISKNPCIQFTGVESKGIQPFPPTPATEMQPPQAKEGKILLSEDSDRDFCSNSHHQEHWNYELVL